MHRSGSMEEGSLASPDGPVLEAILLLASLASPCHSVRLTLVVIIHAIKPSKQLSMIAN